MQKPKVTIGVCVRNCQYYIEETISSIMDQNFPHELMEVIFVDDGSDDDTISIIQKSISRIDIPVTIYHSTWKGIGHARNTVVTEARGKYILWIDGDMIISKDFVSKLTEYMEKDPNVGIVKGRQAIKPGKNFLATLETYSRAAGRMVNYQSDEGRLKSLGTGGAMYRSDVFNQTGLFDEQLRRYGEDYDIEIRVRAAGWILSTFNVSFQDYERYELSWKQLWSKYIQRGYYSHYFYHKNIGFIQPYKFFPLISFLAGILHSHKLFILTNQKIVFLLPFQYLFKMTAWYFGFIKGHLNSLSFS